MPDPLPESLYWDSRDYKESTMKVAGPTNASHFWDRDALVGWGDANESAGRLRCSEFSPVDMERAADLLAATPKPAPDAVRLLERIRDFPYYERSSAQQAMSQLAAEAIALLSAPVPSPDGAQRRNGDPCPHCKKPYFNGDTCTFGGCPLGGDF